MSFVPKSMSIYSLNKQLNTFFSMSSKKMRTKVVTCFTLRIVEHVQVYVLKINCISLLGRQQYLSYLFRVLRENLRLFIFLIFVYFHVKIYELLHSFWTSYDNIKRIIIIRLVSYYWMLKYVKVTYFFFVLF